MIDLGSSNGIIIKPSKILKSGKKNINSGDEIKIGEISLKLIAIDQRDQLQTMMVDARELLGEVEKIKDKS